MNDAVKAIGVLLAGFGIGAALGFGIGGATFKKPSAPKPAPRKPIAPRAPEPRKTTPEPYVFKEKADPSLTRITPAPTWTDKERAQEIQLRKAQEERTRAKQALPITKPTPRTKERTEWQAQWDEWLRDKRWVVLADKIKKRDNWTCTSCQSKVELEAHHTCYYYDGTKPWEYPEKLITTLCRKCHQKYFERGHRRCP